MVKTLSRGDPTGFFVCDQKKYDINLRRLDLNIDSLKYALHNLQFRRITQIPKILPQEEWDLKYVVEIARANEVESDALMLVDVVKKGLKEGNIFDSNSWIIALD